MLAHDLAAHHAVELALHAGQLAAQLLDAGVGDGADLAVFQRDGVGAVLVGADAVHAQQFPGHLEAGDLLAAVFDALAGLEKAGAHGVEEMEGVAGAVQRIAALDHPAHVHQLFDARGVLAGEAAGQADLAHVAGGAASALPVRFMRLGRGGTAASRGGPDSGDAAGCPRASAAGNAAGDPGGATTLDAAAGRGGADLGNTAGCLRGLPVGNAAGGLVGAAGCKATTDLTGTAGGSAAAGPRGSAGGDEAAGLTVTDAADEAAGLGGTDDGSAVPALGGAAGGAWEWANGMMFSSVMCGPAGAPAYATWASSVGLGWGSPLAGVW